MCKSGQLGIEIIQFYIALVVFVSSSFPLNHYLNRTSDRFRLCTSSFQGRTGNVCLGLVGGNRVRGRGLFSFVTHRIWAVVHEDDAVKSLQAPPQVEVNFALDVHEEEAWHHAEGHNAKLSPEQPLQRSCNVSKKNTATVRHPHVKAK